MALKNLVFILCACVLSDLLAQKPILKTTSGLTVKYEQSSDSSDGIYRYTVEKPTSQNESNLSRRLIVRLKGEPLAKLRGSEFRSRMQNMQTDHDQFRKDFEAIHTNKRRGRGATSSRILAEYRTIYNGFSVVTDEEGEQKIKSLPYVKMVFPDLRVEITDQASNNIIGAEKVWNDYGFTGKGVVIGIVDTGIDYNHPDLGGGIGADKKVIGGYDFVNEDADPIDDHGHGTHVAGIAAANGSIKGVAPDANLMAFKVLGEGGWGFDSWIIGAIERSVDPDQNPETDDAIDIVNMSLGRSIDGNDPYAEAIQNATAMGVLFVVAAGNSYGKQSIGTPGVVDAALTVAATDSTDATADFSSKGPSPDFNLKPDVAAPGVGIYSSFLDGGYQTWNGTSMATPHVTGAAALLLEKYPDWTPDMVKSLLMNTVKASSDPIWYQGAGRIDVAKAVAAGFLVDPGSISLGLVSTGQAVTREVIVSVANLSDHARVFSVEVSGQLLDFVNATVQPSSLNLAAGQSGSVTLKVNIGADLPIKDFMLGYQGNLSVSSEGETTTTIISLIRLPYTKLIFSDPLPYTVIAGGINQFHSLVLSPKQPEMNVVLPVGDCDIYAYYQNGEYIVAKEGINGSVDNEVAMTQDIAKNQIIFSFKDDQGLPITIDPYRQVGVSILSGRKVLGFYFFPVDTIYISDSDYMLMDVVVRDTVRGNYFDFARGTGYGPKQSMLLSNDEPFTRIVFKTPEKGKFQFQYLTKGVHISKGGISAFNTEPVSYTDSMTVYMSQRLPDDNFAYSKALIRRDGESTIAYESGYMSARAGNKVVFNPVGANYWQNKTAVYETSHLNHSIGNSLLTWKGRLINSDNQATVNESLSRGLFNTSLGDCIRGDVKFLLRSEDQVLDSGVVTNRTSMDYWQTYQEEVLTLKTSPKPHALEFEFDRNMILDTLGSARVELKFNPALIDKNPPVMDFFALVSNGINTNHVKQGDDIFIKMSINDCSEGYDGCYDIKKMTNNIFIKMSSSSDEWQELPQFPVSGDTVLIDIPNFLEPGYYSVKVNSTDQSGNSMNYTLEPGFHVGPIGEILAEQVVLVKPANHSVDVERMTEFKWYAMDKATSYTIQLSFTTSFTTLIGSYTLSDTVFTTPAKFGYREHLYWRVQPHFGPFDGQWSSIFSFTTVNRKLELIAPANHSTVDVVEGAYFDWELLGEADHYTIQLSAYPDFHGSSLTLYLTGPQTIFPQINFNSTYYWRVRPEFGTTSGAWSDPFRFQTNAYTVTLLEPWSHSQIIIDDDENLLLKWSGSEVANGYQVQLSLSPNFYLLHEFAIVDDPYFTTTRSLSKNFKYYWRVMPFYGSTRIPGTWSEPFDFTRVDAITRTSVTPNPFSSSTRINVYIVERGTASVELLSAEGRLLRKTVHTFSEGGIQSIEINTNLAPGLYYARVQTASGVEVVKLVAR